MLQEIDLPNRFTNLNFFSIKSVQTLIVALLHTLLVVPVLDLLFTINHIPYFEIIVFFFIGSQIFTSLFKKWWLNFLANFGLIFYVLYQLFPPAFFEELTPDYTYRDWLRQLWLAGSGEIQELISGSIENFPLVLVFTLSFVVISLITYNTVRLKKPLISFLLSFSYLILVNTFNSRDIYIYVIHVIGMGILLLTFCRLKNETSWRNFFKAGLITCLLTAIFLFASYSGVNRLAPAQDWVEVQSLSYQQTLHDRGFFDLINRLSPGSALSRTGMGLDDSELGGPLQTDHTNLFRAYSSQPHYWRVMTRDTYTGIGWYSESIGREVYYTAGQDDYYSTNTNDENIETVFHAWHEPAPYVAYPYGMDGFNINDDSDARHGLFTHHLDIDYYALTGDQNVDSYTVGFDVNFPTRLTEEVLEHTELWTEDQEIIDSLYGGDYGEYFASYLQLPDNLPQRVIDLAHDITEDYETEFEKVRAIEQYLKTDGDYRYNLSEVAETPFGRDYVDHFLFDTLVGYCDNFSTAMTVMVRAIGIPARWAKGFTPGTQQVDSNGNQYYQVSNANAHSWTEVYFHGYGFLPFEPSPSFSNPITNEGLVTQIGSDIYEYDEGILDVDDLDREEDSETDVDLEQPETDDEEEEEEVDEIEVEEDEDESTTLFGFGSGGQGAAQFGQGVILAFLIGMTSFLLFFYRYSILYTVCKFIIKNDWLSPRQTCSLTLKLYNRKRPRLKGETVKDYFEWWKAFAFRDREIIEQFIQLSESVFYGPPNNEGLTDAQKLTAISMLKDYKELPEMPRRGAKVPEP